MSNFFMLAGTVLSDIHLTDIQALLAKQSILSEIEEDELVVRGVATFIFRTGFEHEYILVGDAADGETLLTETERISTLLREHHITHAYEIYADDNQQIFDYEFEG